MKAKILTVQGKSMAPYICSGDTLLVDENTPPQIGDLVFLSRKLSNQLIVHRLIQESKTKGDREKEIDQIIWHDLEVIGTVIGKVNKHKTVLFKQPATQFIHKLQAKLSTFNTHENQLIAKLCVTLLIITGKALRTFQGWSFHE